MVSMPHPSSSDDSVLARYTFVVSGAPSTSLDGIAPKGALCVDKTSATLYINKGTKSKATWTVFESGSGGDIDVAWSDVTDKPAVIAAGATEAEARSAIGAGTSNLALGTTASTAKAGNYAPAWGEVTGKPAAQLMSGTAPTQADSEAADAAGVVADLNTLLANLRTRGVIA